jgi:MYXO-CTERM domain-containing protein
MSDRMRNGAVVGVIAAMLLSSSPAWAEAVCYRLPFGNIGFRWHATTPSGGQHRGVDFPQGAGVAIPAVADGVVVVNTTNGCLGNVIVLAHADGMFSGYSHMNARSGLAINTRVSKGQTIGHVGSSGSCAMGSHLHLTMSDHASGYYTGSTVDPIAYINSHTTCAPPNKAPIGALDAVSCELATGWAQDPDEPDRAISVHVYLNGAAGDPAASSFATTAGVRREDLCAAINSCEHGFSWHIPLAFLDGAEHPVRAYAIDTAGGANPLLQNSPLTVACPAPELPTYSGGLVRRFISSPPVMTAWQLGVLDISSRDDAELAAIPDGTPLPEAPDLIRIDGGPQIYALEYGILRPIADRAGWRLGPVALREVSSAESGDWIFGAPWPETPFLVKGSADSVYMMDAPPPLWAELVAEDLPDAIPAGSTAQVTFQLRNKGSLTWLDGDVALAPTPRDMDSALCDPSWPSCSRAALITGETATGGTATVTVTLLAPMEQGPLDLCFGMVRGARWFSEEGQLGPADDAICQTITIGPPDLTPRSADMGQGGDMGQGDPDMMGATPGPNAQDVEMDGGCGCGATPGQAPPTALFLLWGAVGLIRRRRC